MIDSTWKQPRWMFYFAGCRDSEKGKIFGENYNEEGVFPVSIFDDAWCISRDIGR